MNLPEPWLRAATALVSVTTLLVTAGCDGSDVTGADSRHVSILSGAALSDTVYARPAEPLTIELTDGGGQPAAGIEVVFSSVVHPEYGSGVAFRQEGRTFATLRDTTDADGRVSVGLQFLGPHAHNSGAVISVPAWRRVEIDTVHYAILPGAVHAIVPPPSYTAVTIGDSVAYPALLYDTYGNIRQEGALCTVSNDLARVSGECMLHGLAFGAATVTLHHGDLSASAPLVVVPAGEIAIENYGLEVLRLDGSSYRKVDYSGITPGWTASGDSLLFAKSDPAGGPRHLWITDPDQPGTERAAIPSRSGSPGEASPEATRDGAWIYFSAAVGDLQHGSEIWRARRDGTAAERVTALSTEGRRDFAPSLDSGGERLLYTSCAGPFDCVPVLRILNLVTGTDREVAAGTMGRFSPDGARIAALRDGAVVLLDASGVDLREFDSPANATGVDWSPDGQFLVVTAVIPVPHGERETALFVLQVETGTSVPLRRLDTPGGALHARPLPGHPRWRP